MAGVIIFVYTSYCKTAMCFAGNCGGSRQKNGNAGSKQYKEGIYDKIWRK